VRAARIALAAVALVLALGAVVLAREVASRRDRIVIGDRARAANPVAVVDWTPSANLPFDPAGRLVGLGDDIALREATRAFVIAERTGQGFDNGRERALRRDAAEAALEGVVLAGSPLEVARADVLLGVLAFDSSATSVATPGQQSVDAFSEAARLDPSDTAAKFDLELALRALAPSGTRPGSNPSAGGKGHGRRGAGAGLPGSGF
jgi:ABC-type amino acid transport substrate-binding protein